MSVFRLVHASDAKPVAAAQRLCDAIGKTSEPLLALVYMNASAARESARVLDLLTGSYPAITWVGASAYSVIANDQEMGDEPAIAAMLLELSAEHWSTYSANNPIPEQMHTALVHADPSAVDLVESVQAMSERAQTGYLFGGLTSGKGDLGRQICSGQSMDTSMSGVAFDGSVRLLSRVTQGCSPLASEHVVTESTDNYIHQLDDEPALDVLLRDLNIDKSIRESRDPEQLLAALSGQRLANGLLVGLNDSMQDRNMGFGDYLVRNLIGIDPENRLIAIGAEPSSGDRLVFCTRDKEAARADLIRMCTELRDEVESASLNVLGAHYVSCLARGHSLFGSVGAEAALLTHNLGDIPLVGFFANGEIARERLYAHTGVLTLFVDAK